MLVQQPNVSQMWCYETNCTHFLHRLHDLKLSLTIPASHRISTFFLFLVTTFWPRVLSSSLMSVCVWKHGRPWERRDKKSRHLRCHASTGLKRACLSLYWQALKMRLKSLGTCYFSDKQRDGKKTRRDMLQCSLAFVCWEHSSSGAVTLHRRDWHIRDQYIPTLKSFKHETQTLQKCRMNPHRQKVV